MKRLNLPRWTLLGGLWFLGIVLNGLVMPARWTPRVQVETVVEAPLALVVRAPGHLDAKSSVTLKAQFDGPVTSKHFHEGQRVEAGELLAVIDTDKIRIEHQEKQDALSNAQSELERAKKEVRLQKSLYKSQAVAYTSVEEARNNLTKATQALRVAEENWRQEQVRWNSAKVISPTKGTVVKDGVGDEKGVASGKEIVTVADMTDFTVKARVDELDIRRVEEGQLADVHIQIYPQQVFKAKVTQVGTQPDAPDSTAIPVVLTLEDSQGVLLRPKLTADIRIIMGTTPPVLSVPLSAISNADGTTRVWVLDLWGRLRARPIVLGKMNPERGEVTQGLHAGDRISTSAPQGLADGMRVFSETETRAAPRKSLFQIISRLWNEIAREENT